MSGRELETVMFVKQHDVVQLSNVWRSCILSSGD